MCPQRVLVVDDEPDPRRVLCRFLAAQNFEAASASSAAEAVSMVRAFAPDVALVDISMPRVNGIDLLHALRRDPATAWLPVVLMTGYSIPDNVIRVAAGNLEIGPIYSKGGDLLDLVLRINQALAASESAKSASSARYLRRGRLLADIVVRKVWIDGKELPLHGWHMFDLLYALMSSSEPVSKQSLHRAIWSDSDNVGIVAVNIMRLREALQAYPGVRIEFSGGGYRLIA